MARGGPSAAASPQLPLLASEPPRAGGKSPRAVPASRHRCDRAALGTSACRGSGEPPGALRLTIPTFCTPAGRAGRPLRHRAAPARPAGVRHWTCSASARPASIGIWPSNSRARTGCVSAPSGRTKRCQRARRAAGDSATDRGVRAGPGQGFPGQETATLQVDREARHNPVHAVPSVIATRLPAGSSGQRADLHVHSVALQHKYFCKLRCKTSVT
jgi:hypothetical protein